MCTPTKKGLVDRIPEALQYQIDNVVDTVFESVKYIFEEEVTNLKESYIQLAYVTTDKFKEPEKGLDYSSNLRLFPIAIFLFGDKINDEDIEFLGGDTNDTGKYLLIEEPSETPRFEQAINIVKDKQISDGSGPGIIGPIFAKEQKRVVLPRVPRITTRCRKFYIHRSL